MCDFWARTNNQSTGFSIHRMTTAIDAGEILTTRTVPFSDKNYLKTASLTEQFEIQELLALLQRWSQDPVLPTQPPLSANEHTHFQNPGLLDFWKARVQGIKM